MGKQLTHGALGSQDAREGGREENLDAASPSEARPRNSSGTASAAASQLELRQRVLQLEELMMSVLTSLGDEDSIRQLRRTRQQGFRGPRG